MSKDLKKSLSWCAVSFVLILGVELVAHAALHGTAGLAGFAGSAAVGVAAACAMKTPVYWAHELAWGRGDTAEDVTHWFIHEG